MQWIVFSYSLPSKSSSSPRVTLWRRLRRLGAVSPTGGIYVLPAHESCLEAFQWLAQEIEQSNGQAVVMHVEQFDTLTDQQVIDFFRESRREDYAEIEAQALKLEQAITLEMDGKTLADLQESLVKLQRHYADVSAIDYFDSPEGVQVAARLAKIAKNLNPTTDLAPRIESVALETYQDKQWVTRPKPHVDRLACAWFIRRFIDPNAAIRYSPEPKSGEISFDMSEADFGHTGQLCTFETMIRAFGLESPALSRLAEIVHDIDLRDERYFHPEVTGIEAILRGWLLLDLADAELEARGVALFEGLYMLFSLHT